jgi:phenylacetic acid degradation operon negative regulatory protein
MNGRRLAVFLLKIAECYLTSYRKSWHDIFESIGGGYSNKQCSYVKTELRKNGWLDKKDDLMELTEKGRKELWQMFPILKWRKEPWDGIWRVVMYDFPQMDKAKRDKWRKVLKKLGMGQWQLSVWVSPYPIIKKMDQVVRELGLEKWVTVCEVKRVVGASDKEFADRIWGLSKLNMEYKKLVDNWQPENREQCIVKMMKDPLLPKELSPNDWHGARLSRLLFLKK